MAQTDINILLKLKDELSGSMKNAVNSMQDMQRVSTATGISLQQLGRTLTSLAGGYAIIRITSGLLEGAAALQEVKKSGEEMAIAFAKALPVLGEYTSSLVKFLETYYGIKETRQLSDSIDAAQKSIKNIIEPLEESLRILKSTNPELEKLKINFERNAQAIDKIISSGLPQIVGYAKVAKERLFEIYRQQEAILHIKQRAKEFDDAVAKERPYQQAIDDLDKLAEKYKLEIELLEISADKRQSYLQIFQAQKQAIAELNKLKLSTDSYQEAMRRIEEAFKNAIAAVDEYINKQKSLENVSAFLEQQEILYQELQEIGKIPIERQLLRYEESLRKIKKFTEEQITQLVLLKKIILENEEAENQRQEAIKKTQQEMESARKEIDALLVELDEERKLVNLSNEEREVAIKLLQYEKLLRKVYGDDISLINEKLSEYAKKLAIINLYKKGQEYQQYRQQLKEEIAAHFTQIEQEKEMLNLMSKYPEIRREWAKDMVEMRRILREFYGENQEAFEIVFQEYKKQLDILDKTSIQFELIRQAAENTAQSITNGFINIIMQGGKFSDVLKQIYLDLIRMSLQAAFSPLQASLQTSLQGFFGSLFGKTSTIVAHSGGVVGETIFPQRNLPQAAFIFAPKLHNGLFAPDEFPAILQKGERIIPKSRQNGVIINQTFIVNTPDADSFRQSRSQILAQLKGVR